jgi:hypothetical protein
MKTHPKSCPDASDCVPWNQSPTRNEKTVFARMARKRVQAPAWMPSSCSAARRVQAALEPEPEAVTCTDPSAQVELVEQALEKLDAVRMLVGGLPELPLGDRHSLMAQLASTAESLRSLTFLDAIY